jgi:hypothetical protein
VSAVKSEGVDNPEFAYWIARNALKIGSRITPVLDFLSDMNDWVREAKRKTQMHHSSILTGHVSKHGADRK